MENREGASQNPEVTKGLGKNLETIVGNLPENALKSVRGLFDKIKNSVAERV